MILVIMFFLIQYMFSNKMYMKERDLNAILVVSETRVLIIYLTSDRNYFVLFY